ncbi:hypothetical protein [Mangrovibacterium lignilyticum]|uniref:hypothetical protein n=1 Tax=Mangrovibacterium lignilyticum TaxID=2668052 RepID=UPI0013D6D76C|nr:hypothetical protein [Mangrovibacterium lignilyticum]
MEPNNEWLKRNLGLEYHADEDNIWLQKGITLRRLIGILGIMLPVFLWFFLWVSTNRVEELESISHYYYTRVDSIFIITISLLAIFLIIYKGPALVDFYLSLVAGICALLVVLFPTSPLSDHIPDVNMSFFNTVLSDNPTRIMVHYYSAGIFILLLATMLLFLFTKSDKPKATRGTMKIMRNRLYRVCGIGMIAAVLVMGLRGFGWIDAEFYDARNLTFWMEVVAVELFGISWLIKGETLLKDKT